jgi:RHS repeat-associated protein
MSGTPAYHYYLKDHLGNNRMVINQAGTVVQQTDYYPFGMTFNKGGSSDNKYLFQGKELQDDFELDIYDFHARGYDPTLGRTWQPDPMAEKFYSLSPYSMFANNPLRYIDPTGMEFTEASWEWVNKLIADVNRRQATNNVQIANRQAKIDVGGVSDRRANRLNRQIGRLENANASLETVRGEVATLAASDQVYNVSSISSSSATTTDAIGNSTITASTSFNTTTKAVDINISSNAGIRLFAHELKHAYQFDQGQMSLGSFGIKSPSYFLYDKQDEYGAFARQGLFGSTETTLPSRYNSLPTGPIDINNYNYNGRKLSQMNVYELQYLSKGVMKQAFRYKIDGVWRTFHH